MITIIDYGMGNLGSVKNMFRKIDEESIITSDLAEIEKAEKILLPGVGAFDNAIKNIDSMGLRSVLNKKALEDKIPFLGICLGMQLLTKNSQEGELKGLGWFDAEVKKFSFDENSPLKIPHMGWNILKPENACILFENMHSPELRYYFVHSYHVVCHNEKDIAGSTFHGYNFTSAIAKGNIYGVQFHPEKSHKFGMQLLKNFSNLSC